MADIKIDILDPNGNAGTLSVTMREGGRGQAVVEFPNAAPDRVARELTDVSRDLSGTRLSGVFEEGTEAAVLAIDIDADRAPPEVRVSLEGPTRLEELVATLSTADASALRDFVNGLDDATLVRPIRELPSGPEWQQGLQSAAQMGALGLRKALRDRLFSGDATALEYHGSPPFSMRRVDGAPGQMELTIRVSVDPSQLLPTS